MKAIVLRTPGAGPSAWQLAERPDLVPGPNQILVRVRAASLNYRDLSVATGFFGPTKPELIPASDAAGEVVALGAGVTAWRPGDRVMSAFFPRWRDGAMRAEDPQTALGVADRDGVLAQYAVLDAGGAAAIPAGMSFERAATLPCAALTAWHALATGPRVPPGGSVLVQGTGGVSLFAAQLARAQGLRVIATTSSAAKAARLRELGVSDVVNYREQPEWDAEVVRRTGGAGVDHVIEVGGGGTLPRSLAAVAHGGTVSVIGLLTGMPPIDPLPILLRAIHVRGVLVGSVAMLEALVRAVTALEIAPVIDDVVPLERAGDALARLARGEHFGKLVVRVE